MIRKYILWYIDKQLGFQKRVQAHCAPPPISYSVDMMPTSTSVACKLMLNCYSKDMRDMRISEDMKTSRMIHTLYMDIERDQRKEQP